MPVLGKTPTPSHLDKLKENFQDVEGFGMPIPRKINFAAVEIDDEVVEDVKDILQICSPSQETSADGSSPRTGEEEEDPPSSFEILTDLASQKVSFPLPLILLIIPSNYKNEDPAALFSDPETSPDQDKESQKVNKAPAYSLPVSLS